MGSKMVSVRMMSGVKTVRPWGLVDIPLSTSLTKLYEDVSRGLLDGFILKQEYTECSVHASIAESPNATTHTVPMTGKIEDIIEFGKYITFLLEVENQAPLKPVNAIAYIMNQSQRKKKVWPKFKNLDRPNMRFKLFNDIIVDLEKIGLGWSLEAKSLGENYIDTLSEALWLVDPHRQTLTMQQCAVPSFWDQYQGYNNPMAHGHTVKSLSADKIYTLQQLMFNILEQSWLNKLEWQAWKEATEGLARVLKDYSLYLMKKNVQVKANNAKLEPVRSLDDSIGIFHLHINLTSRPEKLSSITDSLSAIDFYEPMFLNPHLPLDKAKRHDLITFLKKEGLPYRTTLFTHSSGGNIGNSHFIWKAEMAADQNTVSTKSTTISTKLLQSMPTYHTRQMRREFVSLFGRIAKYKPAHLREMYKLLTNDASAACNETTAEIDQRVQLMLELQDPDIVTDLRSNNPGRTSKYDGFWEQASLYLENVAQTAVHERRHGDKDVTYMASAMSARHLLEEVTKKCPEGTPVPSVQWLRLQFWPKNPTTKAALQYTGKLKIKYMVQQRQYRNASEDQHYASAIYRYEKEMAIKFRKYGIFVSQDDKHKIKVGEPGHPVAAVERGKSVLVGCDQSFQVADHDFTKVGLTPSVNLIIDIPDVITESFYRGQVHIGLKDTTFEPSSPLRHITELHSVIKDASSEKAILFIYADGGPDHRLTYASVQLTLISLFLLEDYDAVIVVRTPPGHSWKNPVERIMSIINLGLQSVGVMREIMYPEMEDLLKRCSNMKEVRKLAETHPGFREACLKSVKQPISLITEQLKGLSLKEEKFKIFDSATEEEMSQFEKELQKINEKVNLKMTRKDIDKIPEMLEFEKNHVKRGHYIYCVKKCTNVSCTIHKMPRLPQEIFEELDFLPDPMPTADGMQYKPFDEVYKTVTTETHRPSLQRASSKMGHSLPFNPSAQTAGRVKRTIRCEECDKPRVLHSAKKLKMKELDELERAIEDVSFTCGTTMAECGNDDEILKKVYVRGDLRCIAPIEIPYYASDSFPRVCCYCATGDDLVTGQKAADIYPTCNDCYQVKPKLLKRKRKLFTAACDRD